MSDLDLWRCLCGWEGSGADVKSKPVGEKGKVVVLCPASGHTKLRLVSAPLSAQTESTCGRTAQIAWAKTLHRRERRVTARDNVDVVAYTDGSSTGSYAAVVQDLHNRQKGSSLVDYVRHAKQNPARNVAAEILGVALALRHTPRGSRVMVVTDYIGTAHWLDGAYSIRCAHSLLRLRAILRLIEERDLAVRMVHHRGHQKDRSQFSVYNNRADRLACVAARQAYLESKEDQ